MFQLTSRRNDIEINAEFQVRGREESRAFEGEEEKVRWPENSCTSQRTEGNLSVMSGWHQNKWEQEQAPGLALLCSNQEGEQILKSSGFHLSMISF